MVNTIQEGKFLKGGDRISHTFMAPITPRLCFMCICLFKKHKYVIEFLLYFYFGGNSKMSKIHPKVKAVNILKVSRRNRHKKVLMMH